MNENNNRRTPSSEASENDWTDSSEGSSKYSDSDSSVPEWDEHVRPDGELVYMKYKDDSSPANIPPAATSLLDESRRNYVRNSFKRSSTRRASRGKFFKVLRNYKNSRKNDSNSKDKRLANDPIDKPISLPEKEIRSCLKNDEQKDVVIEIDTSVIYRSDKCCRVEQLLGFGVRKSEDNRKLIVADVLSEARNIYDARIKRGFILKSINNEDINPYNINTILDRLWNTRQHIILTFHSSIQRVTPIDVDLRNLLTSKNEHEVVLSQVLRDCLVSILYINCDAMSDKGPDDQGVLYCYPRPTHQNFLFNTKGAYVTLNHLMPKTLSDNYPSSTTILVHDCVVNVSYTQRENDLLLLAMPQSKCNPYGLKLFTADMVRMFEFVHGSLRNCFSKSTNVEKLDHIFSRIFSMVICGADSIDLRHTVKIEDIVSQRAKNCDGLFEQFLPMAHIATLPREARLQVDDSLTELEAADYREWTDDPMNTQRLYVVIGCCLYYSGHLLSSHLQDADLIDVHSFLRTNGLLALSRMSEMEKLVVWKEVYISAHRNQRVGVNGDSNDFKLHDARWFLLVVGKGNFLLATIMEAGGCTEDAVGNPAPSPFYVEECESCVELLIDVGLDTFLKTWFSSNSRPQVQIHPQCLTKYGKKMRDIIGLQKLEHSPVNRIGNASSSKTSPSPDYHTILRRRHHSSDHLNMGLSSMSEPTHQQYSSSQFNLNSSWYPGQGYQSRVYSVGNNLDVSYSEDSNSQLSNSEANEDRIMGRRDRESMKQRRTSSQSSGSDSEWENQTGSRASGSLDMSDIKKSLLDEIGDLVIHRITAGEDNVLFHFIQLEARRGMLLAPVKDLEVLANNRLYGYILKAFRQACQKIHILLQDSLRFKQILSPSSSVNKSLVAIKEQGMLLQVPQDVLNQSVVTKRNPDSYNFWVVGRLFNEPEPIELYVCYHESIPQDMCEIAYRLSYLE